MLRFNCFAAIGLECSIWHRLSRSFVYLFGLGMLGNCANVQPMEPTSKPIITPAPVRSAQALHYAATSERDLKEIEKSFQALQQLPVVTDGVTVLQKLNELHLQLEGLGNWAALYSQVHPDPAMREQADKVEQQISKWGARLAMDKSVLGLLQAVDANQLNPTAQRFCRKQIEQLLREGAGLEPAKQEQLQAIREEIVKLGQTFSRNIREDQRTLEISPNKLLGLPEDFIAAHGVKENGKIVISTAYPDYIPIMSMAEDDGLRLEMFTLFRQRGYPNNEAVLQQLLEKRHELANLLGYPNYAAYSTSDKMVGNPERVEQFLKEIQTISQEPARKKYNELLAMTMAKNPQANAVGEWQWAYLEEQYKRQHFQLDGQILRTYFPFAKVQQGLFELSEELFGLHFEPVAGDVWHPDVTLYHVKEQDRLIGQFYLDLHPRADKYGHAAMFPLRGGNGNELLPQAALVCNFPRGQDALLTHGDVTTFFHEFGHLLHHLLGGNQAFVSQSGTSVEWDFVEVPSQLLEEWAFDGPTLLRFAQNQAGEPIPNTLLTALQKARFAGQGLQLRQQLYYAAISLQLHQQPPKPGTLHEVVRSLQQRYSPFAYVPNTYFHLSFGHLEGYSALYYTYMWSLAIARDVLSRFHQTDLHHPEVAKAYRQAILAPGGSKDAKEMIQAFLGRDFSMDALSALLQGKAPEGTGGPEKASKKRPTGKALAPGKANKSKPT